jgi:hypothetical protein
MLLNRLAARNMDRAGRYFNPRRAAAEKRRLPDMPRFHAVIKYAIKHLQGTANKGRHAHIGPPFDFELRSDHGLTGWKFM